jgi:large subunit ribosomal protein L20
MSQAKGFKWGRKNLIKQAKEAVVKAGVHAYEGRKQKKRDNRGLWNIKIGAFAREAGMNYSRLIHQLKSKQVELDRKILADLSENDPDVMSAIVDKTKD